MIDPAALGVGTVVASIASAWGTVKATVSGVSGRVVRIEREVTAHKEKDETQHVEIIDRMARIETKLDILIEEKQ